MLARPDRTELDPEAIGIAALSFLATDDARMQRFLDVTGLEAGQLREEAAKPAFFVGLFDIILAHEPTVLSFAEHAGIGAERVEIARNALAGRA